MQAETGICRVICFSPRHDLTLPEMEAGDIRQVVDLWAEQILDLGSRPEINYVQLFENKGAAMGCSNPHPHGQIWSNYTVPLEPAKEDASQRAYYARHGRRCWSITVNVELAAGERIVVQNDHWVALVPFWAVWPFETLLLPRRHVTGAAGADRRRARGAGRHSQAADDPLRQPVRDQLPLLDGLARPADRRRRAHPHWQLHAHFYPPLLRSATVRKFMVGYEMLGCRSATSPPNRPPTAARAG